MKDVRSRFLDILADQLNIPADSILDHSSLIGLGADSLDLVEIHMRAEDEFDIELDIESEYSVQTVEEAIQRIETALAQDEP